MPPGKARNNLYLLYLQKFLLSLVTAGGLQFMVSTAISLAVFEASPASKKRPQNPLSFIDIAPKAGLTTPNVFGGADRKRYLLETTGSGVGFIDYDRDGLVDLFFVNGKRLDESSTSSGPVNHLYKNRGDGAFTDVTRESGTGYSGWGQGVCVADYDNDGYDDLFVTYYGKNRFYHNNQNGTFTELAEKAGVAGTESRWNTGCAFIDYDRDGNVDLFVANYVDLGLDLSKIPPPGAGQYCQYKGVPLACGPRGLRPAVNHLYRNNGNGTFSDQSEPAGIRRTEGHYALGVLTFDYDNDGWPDIYVACDSAASILYHNNHDGTFKDLGFASGMAYNEDGEPQAGMGVAAADYNHDGHFDVVKTNFSDDSPNLYQNNGNGTFSDRVFLAGLGSLRSFLGWGVMFLDFDNDGWSDILMVNGHLSPEIDAAKIDTEYRQRKLLYRNLTDGNFEDVSLTAGPGPRAPHSSRGAATADLNNDGRLAIAVNEMNEPPSLLALEGIMENHWIGIRTVGSKSNRDGIGARVEIQAGQLKQTDEVRSGSSYLSQNDLRLHFGLGAATNIDRLTVRWPSGVLDRLENIPADQQIILEEGSPSWRVTQQKRH
jgi:enediyne biosynthesis protein E4